MDSSVDRERTDATDAADRPPLDAELIAPTVEGRPSLLAWPIIGGVKLYQLLFRPLFRGACRFQPSCSDYCIGAVTKYGVFRGMIKSVGRICRCHPFNPGGIDEP